MSDAQKNATNWFVKLSSGEATAEDYEQLQSWRQSHVDNENAWQKIQAVSNQFKVKSHSNIVSTLERLYDKPSSESRRSAMKQLGIFIVAGTASYYADEKKPWRAALADYATNTGKTQKIALSDQTLMYVNTQTIVDVHFDENQRTVILHQGEIYIETGHEQNKKHRPFIIKTQHGAVTALGTRFSIRDFQDFAEVNVFEGAVSVQAGKQSTPAIVIKANESMRFDALQPQQKTSAKPASIAWTKGFIIADETQLSAFLLELSRYRPGSISCHPSIAGVKISGSFPIEDTDVVLTALTEKFPIKIQTFTRFWTKVLPA